MSETFSRTCPKCNDVITYDLKRLHYYDSIRSRTCPKCREKERLQKRTRICPLCQKVIVHKSSSTAYYAKRCNQPCKKCSARIESDKKIASETIKWTEIFGVIPKRKSIYYSWKQLWYHRLSEEQRQKVLGLTTQQKIYFWGHIRRWSRAKTIRDLKNVFIKWRGDKHWMKRTDVLTKVIKSCEKYRGDHHWFRLKKVPLE